MNFNQSSVGSIQASARAEAPQQYAVTAAHNRLQGAVDSLFGAIGDLQGRIHPILQPEQDTKSSGAEVAPRSGVPMADAFDYQAEMIEGAVRQLRTLFDRVQL